MCLEMSVGGGGRGLRDHRALDGGALGFLSLFVFRCFFFVLLYVFMLLALLRCFVCVSLFPFCFLVFLCDCFCSAT